MRSLFYRCCWHRVSNLLFLNLAQPATFLQSKIGRACSFKKAVYTPKSLFLHAASLHHAFAHCGRFSTAATRRCLGSVSVPVLGIALLGPLPVIALVGHYPANKLIGRRLFLERPKTLPLRELSGITPSFDELCQTPKQIPTRY